MKQLSLPAMLVLGATLTACAAGMNREELLKEMQERTAPLVVDVRSLSEYTSDHIPDALHMPFLGISSALDARATGREERIVIYCEHGPRAVIAYWSLFLGGYRKVFSLNGHMKGWRESLYPLETIERRP